MPPLHIIFMGTAELACPSLRALCRENDFQLAAVVTQPDRPKGRELKPQFPPVKNVAMEMNLAILQPERARNEVFVQELKARQPDLIVVVAYGQILPPSILEIPRFGCLNVHASLLPQYRGAAPIQWAILDDQPETGVTLMKMDAGLDTGDMLATVTTPIAPDDNAQTLHDRLAQLGAGLLIRTIPDYVAGNISPRPQPAQGAGYARKITKEDGRIDWSQPARAVWNRVRAFTPWPGTFTTLPGGDEASLLKIRSAEIESQQSGRPGEILRADKSGIVIACGESALRISVLQREGGRRLTAAEFIAGHELPIGTILGSE